MRHSRLLSVALVAATFVACGKKTPPPPPPQQQRATPATPPPAPPPEQRDVVRQTDDVTKVHEMAVDEIERLGLFQEVHFEYDKADLRDADKQALSKNADTLKKYFKLRVTVEGHCDDRGTVEYNLALGERRAKASYDYLVSLGVPADRLKTVSYGKEIPLCRDANEDCWVRNRRDHFTVTGKTN